MDRWSFSCKLLGRLWKHLVVAGIQDLVYGTDEEKRLALRVEAGLLRKSKDHQLIRGSAESRHTLQMH